MKTIKTIKTILKSTLALLLIVGCAGEDLSDNSSTDLEQNSILTKSSVSFSLEYNNYLLTETGKQSFSVTSPEGVIDYELTLNGLAFNTSVDTVDGKKELRFTNSNYTTESFLIKNIEIVDDKYSFDVFFGDKLFGGFLSNTNPVETNNWWRIAKAVAAVTIGMIGGGDSDADFTKACGEAVKEGCSSGNVRSIEVTIEGGWFEDDKICKGDCK